MSILNTDLSVLQSLPSPLMLSCILISCSVLMFIIAIWRIRSRERRDLRFLKYGLRAMLRGEPTEAGYKFSVPGAEELWRSIMMLSAAYRQADKHDKEVVNQAITMGSRIVEASDNVASAVDEVAQLLLKQLGRDVVAIAIVMRSASTAELVLERLEGIPKGRISTAILTYFDALFDGSHLQWGYHIPQAGEVYDLRVFDIGLSLSVPLRNQGGICGGIWIGFRQGAVSLAPERKAFVKALAEHAAASFYAAGKMRERTKQSDSERDFLLGMSHDLRAPGNTALYALRDLVSGEVGILSQEQHLRLSVVEKALEDQMAILGDVLDYAKCQKGFLRARKEVTPIRQVMEKVIDNFSFLAAQKGLAIKHELTPDVLCFCDSRQLQRILSNYVSNAIKYTEHGVISFTFSRVDDCVEISVHDTGIGIPEHERDGLFSEFRRLTNGRNQQGFGLGLALSKALAELNGGSVSYRPNSNAGSIFSVRIKMFDGRDEALKEEALLLRSALVVDDDSASCRMNIRLLREVCENAVPAGSVDEAQAIACSLQPSLILTDYDLGGQTAVELLDRLIESGMRFPVIVITGSSDTSLHESLRMKYNAYLLEKPVDRSQLITAIRELFSNADKQSSNLLNYPSSIYS